MDGDGQPPHTSYPWIAAGTASIAWVAAAALITFGGRLAGMASVVVGPALFAWGGACVLCAVLLLRYGAGRFGVMAVAFALASAVVAVPEPAPFGCRDLRWCRA